MRILRQISISAAKLQINFDICKQILKFLLFFAEVNEESGAFVGGFELDAATGAFDDMLGDSEAETVAVGLGGEVRTEDFLLYIRGDSGPVVGNGDLHLALRIKGVEDDDDVGTFTI